MMDLEKEVSKRNTPMTSELKPCTCGPQEGCTETCNRGMSPWEQAIEEARLLPPGTRESTLDWIVDRAAKLNTRPSAEPVAKSQEYRDAEQYKNILYTAQPDTKAVELLRVARDAIGDHYAPSECYSTGPLYGDARDSTCPACRFIAQYESYLKELSHG